MTWDADSLNKIAGAFDSAYSPGQVFRGHPGRECGEHRSTGPRAWCHGCCEWCYPEEPCKGCELPRLRAEIERLRAVKYRAEAAVKPPSVDGDYARGIQAAAQYILTGAFLGDRPEDVAPAVVTGSGADPDYPDVSGGGVPHLPVTPPEHPIA